MAAEISREDQAALDLHKVMLEAIRAREGEILRFAAFLLPAVGGILAFPLVAQVQGKTAPGAPLITTLTVMILLFFGGWYALALSYNYRYLKIVVCRLQHVLSLNTFLPKEWRESEAKWASIPQGKLLLFGFAPEIFRTLVRPLYYRAMMLNKRAREIPKPYPQFRKLSRSGRCATISNKKRTRNFLEHKWDGQHYGARRRVVGC